MQARVVAGALALLCALAGYFALDLLEVGDPWRWLGALGGLALAVGATVAGQRLRQASARAVLAGLGGLLLGLLVARVVADLLGPLTLPLGEAAPDVLRGLLGIVGGYLGAALFVAKVREVRLANLVRLLKEQPRPESYKVLDTSVIIDGRVADVCETGFLEGTLLIPQFVLRELQQIADSSDPLKRNRGRRGLDILQRIQKTLDVQVKIHDMDFPAIREVDAKLVAMAKALTAKVVTNDFNLNKVCELHGVQVLNINELTNALKPVVLPGEDLRVHVLKEGKEYNQGVAYLDDGTMVVVDNGRRFIGQTIDVCATSVLQTTAGRMIFTRLKEEAEAA
jgi:uncharacterized protein YacL